MTEIPSWHITGDWFDNCSCAVACPCTFAQAPDNGFCESVLFWHVREGYYGDVTLDNLSFVRVGRWGGRPLGETGDRDRRPLYRRSCRRSADGRVAGNHRRPRWRLPRLSQRVLRRRTAEPWHRAS